MTTQQTCYMCDAPAVSREHVPPLCFFPEQADAIGGANLRRNLLTVPSCDKHNSHKSADDEYVHSVIVSSDGINEHGQQMVRTKLMRRIARRPAMMSELLRTATPAHVLDPETKQWQKTAAIPLDESRFYGALEGMGRGLYYSHFQTKCVLSARSFPHFLVAGPGPQSIRINRAWRQIAGITDRGFVSAPRLGDNQEIFYYQVHADGIGKPALMRMTFYGGAAVTLAFTTEPMGSSAT